MFRHFKRLRRLFLTHINLVLNAFVESATECDG